MDVNFIRILFLFKTVSIGIVGLLVNCIEPCLPPFVRRTFRYGKFSAKIDPAVAKTIEVPKRWYKHFYMFSAPFSAFVLCLSCYKYFYNGIMPETIYWILDILLGQSRKALVSPESTLLATFLFTVHCSKRLYETLHISVFSDKTINISHYIVGFMHYAGTIICLIGESKGFVKGSLGTFSWANVTTFQLTCVIICLWSSFTQFKANVILSSLRKNKDGVVVTDGYKIPYGDLFDHVSGALQLTEILVYTMISLILWNGSTYHYILVWVFVNQTECALLTHWWYQETFKNYPKTRKALIPYLF